MTTKEDIIEILAVHEDTALARRCRDGTTTLTEVRKVELQEGKPLPTDGELFLLEERADGPLRYNVKSVYNGHKGPAKVTSPRYRAGWEQVFGKTPKDVN